MSGIAGLYWLDGRPAERATIAGMVARLAHRGRDGSGLWCEGPVGLGHQMLWTTPESLYETLPLVGRSGNLVLTADARIDNRDELIAALGFEGRPGAEIGDSELILAAYVRWEERCTEHLLGDFGFALWDGRRQKLFCARDHFGMKPFYYYYRPGLVFVFASEIKALFSLPEVPYELNEVRVGDYLASLAEDKRITFYRDILRLPPAHSLTLGRESDRLRAYWVLDPGQELQCRSDQEYMEAFRDVFERAVQCRLRSAFPLGFALSGGLDSSSVACVARQLSAGNGQHELHTFSAVFDDVPECDERSYIEAVLAQGGLIPHYVHPDQLSALGDIDQVLWHQDQPFYIRNLFLWRALFDAARQQGVRVMLDGEDGDTVVSYGEGYLDELARAGQWAALAGEVGALSMHGHAGCTRPESWLQMYAYPHLERLAHAGRWIAFARAVDVLSRHLNISRNRLVVNQGLKPLAPGVVRQAWHKLRGNGRDTGDDRSLLNPDFAHRIGFVERTLDLAARYQPALTQREEHWQGLSEGIVSCLHEEDNKAAAAFGIETRHPFWDRRVVEFCLALPPELKLHLGWPRWVLRRSMTGVLPAEVQWRTDKSDLSANFAQSLLIFEKERLEKLLDLDRQPIRDYVHLPNLREAYWQGEADSVWPAVVLAVWLDQTELRAPVPTA